MGDDGGDAVEEGGLAPVSTEAPSAWFTVVEPNGHALTRKRRSQADAAQLWEAVQWAIRRGQ